MLKLLNLKNSSQGERIAERCEITLTLYKKENRMKKNLIRFCVSTSIAFFSLQQHSFAMVADPDGDATRSAPVQKAKEQDPEKRSDVVHHPLLDGSKSERKAAIKARNVLIRNAIKLYNEWLKKMPENVNSAAGVIASERLRRDENKEGKDGVKKIARGLILGMSAIGWAAMTGEGFGREDAFNFLALAYGAKEFVDGGKNLYNAYWRE
jgi:hypothetical protein